MPDLQSIVERMIAAGESEDDIALVIKEYKAQAPAASPSRPSGEIDAHGNTITRNPDGSVKTIVGPGYRGTTEHRPDSNVMTIGGFGIAPEDILAAPAMARGVAAAARGVGRLAGAARGPVAGALDLTSAALDNPIVGTVSPRAGQAGKLIGAAADFIRPKMALPAVEAAQKAVPAAAEAIAPAAAQVAPAAAQAVPAAAKAAPVAPNLALQAAKDVFAATGEAPLKAEVSNTMALIQRGKTPEEALRIVLGNRPAPVAAAVEVAKKLPAMTAEEVKLGQSLMKRGKTFDEAMQAIEAQRAFKSIPGVQSSSEARAALDLRNARGQIKTPSAETAAARKLSQPVTSPPGILQSTGPYNKSALHITTPEAASAIRKEGFDVARRGGLGGDDYGPGVYLADEARDMGSFWRQELASKNPTGVVPTAAMSGKVSLKNPFHYEYNKYSKVGDIIGEITPRDAIAAQSPRLLSEFDRLVASGLSPKRALGDVVKKAGYDGLVIEHRAGDEILAFDAGSVSWRQP